MLTMYCGYSVTMSSVLLGNVCNLLTLILKTAGIWTQSIGYALSDIIFFYYSFVFVNIQYV